MGQVVKMTAQIELERLPREIQKALEPVRKERPWLPGEALLGEALSRNPQLIRTFREWEAAGRPSPRELEARKGAENLGQLLAKAEKLGQAIAGLRERAERLYPPPPPALRNSAPAPRVESRTLPVRKSSEDWRAGALEAIVADLYALADALPPNLARRLVSVINELSAIAEEIGGESARKRLKAMAAM